MWRKKEKFEEIYNKFGDNGEEQRKIEGMVMEILKRERRRQLVGPGVTMNHNDCQGGSMVPSG